MVYRQELVDAFRAPLPPVEPSRQRLSIDEVRASAQRAYREYEILSKGEGVAELHWYEAHGIGKKEFKRKTYLD